MIGSIHRENRRTVPRRRYENVHLRRDSWTVHRDYIGTVGDLGIERAVGADEYTPALVQVFVWVVSALKD